MKKIGIWIDKKKAHIVTIENNEATMATIFSEVEDYNITGNRFIGGPQEIVKDVKYLERKKHQFKNYFKAVAEKIEDASSIVIFGPANIGEKIKKELQSHYKNIHSKVRAVKKADSMTNNQVKAWVRDFYELNQ